LLLNIPIEKWIVPEFSMQGTKAPIDTCADDDKWRFTNNKCDLIEDRATRA